MAFIFPYPEGSDIPSILVPYVASYKYDLDVPDAFTRFAHQQGFTSKAYQELDITRDVSELSSLMQSWLYFGLIEEVTDQPVDHTMFLHRDRDDEEDVPCIDIRLNLDLDTLLINSKRVDDGLEQQFQDRRRRHINKCLDYACSMCDLFETVSASHDTTFAAICLSVRLLLVHLIRVAEDGKLVENGQKFKFETPLSKTSQPRIKHTARRATVITSSAYWHLSANPLQ